MVVTNVLLFVSIFFIISLSGSDIQYEISDIKYQTPMCTINGSSMDNILGHMKIMNDLLGENLIITYNLSRSFYSCYLCSQYPEYCGVLISSEYIYLTTNILYNLQLLTIDANNTPQKVHTFNVESELGYKTFNSNITIPFNMLFPYNDNNSNNNDDGSYCLKNYSFLIVGLITIDIVNNKEIVTITHPPINSNSNPISCNPSPQYTQLGIDCNMVPLLYPIRYTIDSCVKTKIYNASSPSIYYPTLTYYPPLFWYYEMVFDDLLSTKETILCGQRYDEILFGSGLYQAVCYNSKSHQDEITKYWWVNLFIQLLSLESNVDGLYDTSGISPIVREVIYETRDLLERNCDSRRKIMKGGSQPMVLGKIKGLYRNQSSINQTELCVELYHYFEKNYNQTRGDNNFIHLFNRWYIEIFKFIIYPNKIVETKVVLSVGLTFFFLLFLVMAIGILQFRLKVRVKKTNQFVTVDNPYENVDERNLVGGIRKSRK